MKYCDIMPGGVKDAKYEIMLIHMNNSIVSIINTKPEDQTKSFTMKGDPTIPILPLTTTCEKRSLPPPPPFKGCTDEDAISRDFLPNLRSNYDNFHFGGRGE